MSPSPFADGVFFRSFFAHWDLQQCQSLSCLSVPKARPNPCSLNPGLWRAVAVNTFDETETGKATTVTFIDARRPGGLSEQATEAETAACLGLDKSATGLVEWDVYDAVLTPGDHILMLAWRTKEDADSFAGAARLPEGGRLRQVRIVRDYGMFDRREAPQYYPAVERSRSGA